MRTIPPFGRALYRKSPGRAFLRSGECCSVGMRDCVMSYWVILLGDRDHFYNYYKRGKMRSLFRMIFIYFQTRLLAERLFECSSLQKLGHLSLSSEFKPILCISALLASWGVTIE